MSIIKQNYELSIWDVAAQKETKIAIIGANDMLSPARAQSPQLKRNINGTKTLTFSLYTKYIDEIDGERKINPFCNLIHNESRLKLKWKNKWYEFIVKNIVEDSENNKNTYIAEDAFILELSRKGFNIELNTDLENNQGTLIELEKKILKNSDWQVDEENSSVGPQLKEDTLVKLITTKEIIVTERCEINSNGILEITKQEFKIPAKATIYTFYSAIYKKDNFLQFYYNNEYKFGDDGFIINCPIYCIDDYKFTGDLPANTKDYELTTYKGKQLIRTQQSIFDKLVNKYVKIYTNGSEEIRGYTTTEYVTDDFVRNLATNGKEFFSDLGWYPLSNKSELEFYSYPTAESILSNLSKNKILESKSYIKIKPLVKNDYVCYNSGFEDNKDLIESLYNGKKFIIRLKYGYKKTSSSEVNKLDYDKTNKLLTHGFKISLCQYDLNEDGDPLVTKVLFETIFNGKTENSFKLVNDYWTAICSCKDNYSKKELLDSNIGIFFSFDILNTSKTINSQNFKNYDFCIEEFEFFEYKEKEIDDNDQNERNYYLIGDTISGEARIKYNYFKPSADYEEAEDIKYEFQGYEEKNYKKKFVPNYQQIRTIEGKESNIFNLTQTLCETFETWADFVVEHDELGYTKKDSKGNFIKKIVFKPFIGKENWSGFHYKTNLKSIQRTTESKQITTKSIVKPNYNEFAPSGFCTIAYADENPSGESFIYDFRYYENQNLLDSKILTEELHGKNGLYIKLKSLNNQIQEEITKRIDATTQILYWEKEKEILTAKESELTTLIATNKKQFRTLTGATYEKFLNNTKTQKSLMEMDEVPGLFLSIYNDVNELKNIKTQTTKAKEQYKIVKNNYNKAVKQIQNLTSQKEKLILDFETKYSPFIQEGTWISNEYIDHNLYYVDAKTVAATSALPQVIYTINVLDLSALEEFKNYDVEIGDKTYITDPEFFGYITTGMFYTPRRQEVIISETIEELEEPEKNKFTVQNFKTQFEDIFHRITAATQQLKLNEGAYQRASGAFDNYGLDSTVAQNAFNSTNFILVNNTNKWDSQGFISTSAKDKHQGLKIHDGAIFISKANGSWDKIISGKGINADYIYAGQLDAGKINIVSELKTSEDQELQYAVTFDKDGLSMYNYEDTKKIRLRLGKVLEDGETLSELYGLQLYNANGEQTFRTDSDGNISITGEITAGSGMIGGWGIEEGRLVHYNDEEIIDAFISAEQGEFYSVNDYSSDNWRLLLGINGTEANFGITGNGNLFANGVDIRDGNISVGDIFKVTTNGGKDQVMTYGLNIKLNPENQNEEIVIESDDRVIGIRERRQDGKGWTWKTILGDLTNATLGGTPLKDLGLTGYGLCTENGLFSGTIYAGSGKIGNFEITDNSIINKVDGDSFFPNGEEEQASGIYLGRDGRFFCGDKTEYIKFDDNLTIKVDNLYLEKETSYIIFGKSEDEDGFTILRVHNGQFYIDARNDFTVYSYDFNLTSLGQDHNQDGVIDGMGYIYIKDYSTRMDGIYRVRRSHEIDEKEYSFQSEVGMTTLYNGLSYFKTNHAGIQVALDKTSNDINPDITGALIISENYEELTCTGYGSAVLKITGKNSKESKLCLETNPNYISYIKTLGDFKIEANSINLVANTLKINNENWLNKVYPIGSIYMSVNSTNPSSLFGGTWVAWGSGRVPVGVNTSDTDFNTVEKENGTKTKSYTPKGTNSGTSITVNQMPSHSHGVTSATAANHTHTLGNSTYPIQGVEGGINASILRERPPRNDEEYSFLTGQTKAVRPEIKTFSSTGSAGANVTVTIGATGGGQTHTHTFTGTASNINVLQPYITCYMWKRTG